jgi:hypothetical protein
MIDELGEDQCQQLIANFSCPFAEDIEYFSDKMFIHTIYRPGLCNFD